MKRKTEAGLGESGKKMENVRKMVKTLASRKKVDAGSTADVQWEVTGSQWREQRDIRSDEISCGTMESKRHQSQEHRHRHEHHGIVITFEPTDDGDFLDNWGRWFGSDGGCLRIQDML